MIFTFHFCQFAYKSIKKQQRAMNLMMLGFEIAVSHCVQCKPFAIFNKMFDFIGNARSPGRSAAKVINK